jgi:hypothetical protein
MARSIVSIVLLGITALIGVLDVFEGKLLLRSADLLSADHASTMPSGAIGV